MDTQEDQEVSIWGDIVDRISTLRRSMERQLAGNQRKIRQGLSVAILGAPNAGKSSLFNLLVNQEAAIVSPVAGTTRDVLQVNLQLGGMLCLLKDTAGVRQESGDEIEVLGIERATQAAQTADLVVVLIAKTEVDAGLAVLDSLDVDPSKIMLVYNKCDLEGPSKPYSSFPAFEISCKTQQGVPELLQGLEKMVVASVGDEEETAMITRERHRLHVEAACQALEGFDQRSQEGIAAVDLAAEELRLAASELGRVTGAVDVEDVLDRLFSDFCIGK